MGNETISFTASDSINGNNINDCLSSLYLFIFRKFIFSDKVTKEKAALFEDVVSSFSSVKEILSRFELWKFGFSESYKDAYMGICIPKLIAPFVKLELLLWNPLEVFWLKKHRLFLF